MPSQPQFDKYIASNSCCLKDQIIPFGVVLLGKVPICTARRPCGPGCIGRIWTASRKPDGSAIVATGAHGSELEQGLCIAAQHLLPIPRGKTETLDPVGPRLVRCERPVDREHDAINPHLGNAARERSVREISACRQMEML